MSPEETPSQRIAVIWSPEARADVRAIPRETALQILHCLDRYLLHREGDVKKLKPPLRESREKRRRSGKDVIPVCVPGTPTRRLCGFESSKPPFGTGPHVVAGPRTI